MINKEEFHNLNLFTIRYPFTAIISILHRLSGVFIFVFIPFLLWLLDIALSSESGFKHIQSVLTHTGCKLLLWFILTAIWYHFLAGIRHILMDIGLGESLVSAKVSGYIILILTVIFAILIGQWLW